MGRKYDKPESIFSPGGAHESISLPMAIKVVRVSAGLLLLALMEEDILRLKGKPLLWSKSYNE